MLVLSEGPMTRETAKNPDGIEEVRQDFEIEKRGVSRASNFFSSSWFEGLSKPENKKGRNPTFAVLKNQSEKQKEVKQTVTETTNTTGRPA
jgi:hypothetical protein